MWSVLIPQYSKNRNIGSEVVFSIISFGTFLSPESREDSALDCKIRITKITPGYKTVLFQQT